MSPVPRGQRYYEGATTSHPRIDGRLLVSLPPPTRPSLVRVSPQRSAGLEVSRGPGPCSLAALLQFLSRGREWDLSGLQAIHPVPLLRSRTPVEPTCPRLIGHVDAAPAFRNAKASARMISGLTRSFDTCYRTLHAWRGRTRARLASDWRAAPLPGGRRTLWTATKGFSSLSRPSSFPALLTLPEPIITGLGLWIPGARPSASPRNDSA